MFEQSKGIWDGMEALLCDRGGEALLAEVFPLSKPRRLPNDVSGAIEFMGPVSLPGMLGHLTSVRRLIKSLSSATKCHPFNDEWRARHNGAPDVSREFNPLFLLCTGDLCGIDCSELTELFGSGFPMVGSFSAPHVFPAGEESTHVSIDDLLATAPTRWAELPSLFKASPPEDNLVLWKEALEEVSAGWLGAPVLFDSPPPGCIPIRRFLVRQGDKCRPCENCRRSGTNAAAVVETPIRLCCVGDLLEVADRVSSTDGRCAFFKADHKDAFKQLPLRKGHGDLFRIILRGPHDGSLYMFKPRRLVFGATLSVLGYNLVSRTIQSIFTRLARVPLISYYDDFAGTSRPGGEREGLEVFKELNAAIGTSLKDEKEHCGEDVGFLGLTIHGGSLPISVECPHEKLAGYRTIIGEIIRGNSCPPSLAASLAGKLNFSAFWIWGRSPRVYLAPIYRQAAQLSSGIDQRLRRALEWWLVFLEGPQSRAFRRPPADISAALFTDASQNRLGAYYRARGASYTFTSPAPDDLILPPSDNRIFILELYAMLMGATILRRYLTGAHSVIFSVDNNSALSASLKGHCSASELASRVIEKFWSVLAPTCISIWIERVPTAKNYADRPSRHLSRNDRVLPFPDLGGGRGPPSRTSPESPPAVSARQRECK